MNCHIVSQFYFKPFSCNKKKSEIHAYARDGTTSKKLIRNVASKEDYYIKIDKTTGESSTYIEEEFSKIESRASTVFRTLIRRDLLDLSCADLLCRGARNHLAQFLSSLWIRNPVQIERIKNIRLLPNHIYKKPESEIESLAKQGHYSKINFGNTEEDLAFRDSFNSDQYIYQSLLKRNWYLLINETGLPFITSDNPLILTYHDTQSIAEKCLSFEESNLYLPISPRRALFLCATNSPRDEMIILRIDEVEKISGFNIQIMHHANNEVYSKEFSKDIKRKFKKTNAGASTKLAPGELSRLRSQQSMN